MKTAAIIQARMTSSRLPGKALKPLFGKPALEWMIERVKQSKVDEIIVAMPNTPNEQPIAKLCQRLGVQVYRGSTNNVLERVLKAARKFEVDTIVELTGDCPLIDPEHIDYLLEKHRQNQWADLTTNIMRRTFPRGYDIRIFDTNALDRVNKEVDNQVDREHVATWMYLNPEGRQGYQVYNWEAPEDQYRPDLEVTLDTEEDLQLLDFVFSFSGQGYNNRKLSCRDVIEILDSYGKGKARPRKDYFEEINRV